MKISGFRLDEEEEALCRRARMGRLDERDARIFERMASRRGLFSGSSFPSGDQPAQAPRRRWDHGLIEAANRRRARFALGEWGPQGRPEAVVKAVSRFHDGASAAKALSYIAGPGGAGRRARADAKNVGAGPAAEATAFPLYDRCGAPAAPAAARTEVRAWRERLGAPSISEPAAPKTGPAFEGTAPAPSGAGRRRVIAWHFVWSIQAPKGGGGDYGEQGDVLRRLKTAAAITFSEVFAANGFRFFWRVHDDTPGHPHVHLLIKARAGNGARIRSGRDGDFLYALRVRFADNLTVCGLPHAATRREDRMPLLYDIAKGRTRLRENQASPRTWLTETRLSRRAPCWWARHGEAALRRMKAERTDGRMFGFISGGVSRARAMRRDMPETHSLIYDDLAGAFRNGAAAYESLMQLAFEAPDGRMCSLGQFPNAKLAAWLLERAPEWFGRPLPGADAKAHIRRAAAHVRALPSGGGLRSARAGAAHEARHDDLSGAPLHPIEAEYGRRTAARSLRRLLAWFRERPHWPEQAAVLQNRIALLEYGAPQTPPKSRSGFRLPPKAAVPASNTLAQTLRPKMTQAPPPPVPKPAPGGAPAAVSPAAPPSAESPPQQAPPLRPTAKRRRGRRDGDLSR